MLNLKTWLQAERGRLSALAKHLDVSQGRITQMADSGVSVDSMLTVRDFTNGEVTIESMLEDRKASKARKTSGAHPQPDAKAA